jgi:hypothetical protein
MAVRALQLSTFRAVRDTLNREGITPESAESTDQQPLNKHVDSKMQHPNRVDRYLHVYIGQAGA